MTPRRGVIISLVAAAAVGSLLFSTLEPAAPSSPIASAAPHALHAVLAEAMPEAGDMDEVREAMPDAEHVEGDMGEEDEVAEDDNRIRDAEDNYHIRDDLKEYRIGDEADVDGDGIDGDNYDIAGTVADEDDEVGDTAQATKKDEEDEEYAEFGDGMGDDAEVGLDADNDGILDAMAGAAKLGTDDDSGGITEVGEDEGDEGDEEHGDEMDDVDEDGDGKACVDVEPACFGSDADNDGMADAMDDLAALDVDAVGSAHAENV